jgi:hypothetical protein
VRIEYLPNQSAEYVVTDTYVTYTLGTGTNGMPAQQQAYIQAAKDAGLIVDVVTLMTMNMGGTDNVVDSQTAVASGTQQVANIFGISTADATKKMGMLPSIGVDNNHIVIDLTGATTRELKFFRVPFISLTECLSYQWAFLLKSIAWRHFLTGTSTVTSPEVMRQHRVSIHPLHLIRRTLRNSL